MEQARLTAYYSSLIHASKRIRIDEFGVFPWENEADFAPRFSKVDPDAWERFNAIQFPDEISSN